jgi:hypothetical protein
MGREKCMMCEQLNGELYCQYYDVACALCEEIESCPDGLDEDEEDDFVDDFDTKDDLYAEGYED